MKAPAITVALLTNLFASIASANQVDSRFDGTWVGVETFPRPAFHDWIGGTPQSRTVISISNSGQILRVLSGFVPGRYWLSPKSNGSTLIFYGNNGVQGRNECRLDLSRDGNSLKESGIVTFRFRNSLVDGFSNRPTSAAVTQIYATFHRAGK